MSNGSQDNRLRVSEVISRAIDENRFGERLLYGFAIVFVAAGIIVLACGVFYSTFAAWAGIAIRQVRIYNMSVDEEEVRVAFTVAAFYIDTSALEAVALNLRNRPRPEVVRLLNVRTV
jgi:hypothetical protein